MRSLSIPARCLAVLGLLTFFGCSDAAPADAGEESSDLASAGIVPASFACKAPHSVDLAVVTGAAKTITVSALFVSATGKLNSHNSASLGQFLSEDNGRFRIELDVAMLRGRSGTATLIEIEDGESAATAYACDKS
jgi:hypothetical protein